MIPERAKFILKVVEGYFHDHHVETLPDMIEPTPEDMPNFKFALNTSGIFLGELAREGWLINAKNNMPLDEHNINKAELAFRIDIKGLRARAAQAPDEPDKPRQVG